MKHKEYPKVIVKGKKHLIISGTGNFYNGKNKTLMSSVDLIQQIDTLEHRLDEKNKLLKEKERLIKVLMKKVK